MNLHPENLTPTSPEQPPKRESLEKAVQERIYFLDFLEKSRDLDKLRGMSSVSRREKAFFDRCRELKDNLKAMEGSKLSTDEKRQLAEAYQYYLQEMAVQCGDNMTEISKKDAGPEILSRASALLNNNIILMTADELSQYYSLGCKEVRSSKEEKQHDRLTKLFYLLINQLIFWSEFPYTNYDPAFLEEEIKQIKGSSLERREKLQKIKQQFTEQQIVMAQLQSDLIRKVQTKTKIDPQQILIEIESRARSAKLDPRQINFLRRLIEKLVKQQEIIHNLLKEKVDDKKFFERFFGSAPAGDVTVHQINTSICFQCSDIRDYARLCRSKFETTDHLTDDDIYLAGQTSGCIVPYYPSPEIQYIFTADYAFNKSLIQSQLIMRHEDQHVVDCIFRDLVYRPCLETIWNETIGRQRNIDNLKKYLRQTRDTIFNEQTADEIIAYYKQQWSPELIQNHVTKTVEQGGSYDYIKNPSYEHIKNHETKEIALTLKTDPDSPEVETLFNKIFYEERDKNIERAIEALKLLEQKGYSRNKIIYMLVPQKLSDWHKIARRILPKKDYAS